MIEFELPPSLPEPPPPPVDPETRIADETNVEALKNDFLGHQQQVLHTDPGALFRQTGEAAMAGAEPALARLSDTRDALLAQAVNPAQRDMLGRALDLHMGVVRGDIDRHVGRQSLDWQRSTAQQRIDLLRKQAGHDYSDPPSIGAYAEASATAALDQARAAGLPPESEAAATLATAARSAVYRGAIEGALAAGDHATAIALHGKAKDRLAPSDANALRRQIEAAAEIETARDYVGKISAPPNEEPRDPPAFFDAPRLMTEADTAHQAATDRNNAD